ncbi:universal stress protein [Streptomyces albus]|uniref:universal stress protein n=1 Tax=Streptomyces albus TaxID=1888 RepID=UPI0036FDEDBB
MSNAVVVGVDGSDESMEATRWAASEAAARDLPLRLLTAVGRRGGPGRLGAGAEVADTTGGDAPESPPRHHLRIAVRHAQEVAPGHEIHEEMVGDGPARALLQATENAALLVLGSRALGPVSGFVLGSVGLSVIAHATAPVVIVRHTGDGGGPVAVGVDLQHTYGPVLDFAFEAAECRGTGVTIAHAWSPRALYSYPSALPDPASMMRTENHAEYELSKAIAPWQRRFPRVPVEGQLAMGATSPFLLDCAKQADLLVVGRRVRGHPFPTRIGPVTHAALHHAPCPVAVVPHP